MLTKVSNSRYSNIKALKLSLGDSIAMCFVAMVNIGSQVMPTRLASRILYLGVLLSGTVFWATYQAALTSVLAVILSKIPIGNLVSLFTCMKITSSDFEFSFKGDAKNLGYKFGVWKGTAVEEIMANSMPGTDSRIVWDEVIQKDR